MKGYKLKSSWPGLIAVLLILVLSVAPLVWFRYHWTVTTDAGRYLVIAGHLASGQSYFAEGGVGYSAVKRGPGFPLLITFLTLLFDHSSRDLAWAIRLLALLNSLLAYMLVKRVSGSAAGLLAALLVTLLGYTAINPDAFNIDAVFLTMYLITLLVLLAAVRRDSTLLAFLSGLLFGAALLTKETMLVNLPLAAVLALLAGWRVRAVLWHYSGVVLACLPWWIWVYLFSAHRGEIFLIGKVSSSLYIPAAAAVAIFLGLALGAYALGIFHRLLGTERRRRRTCWVMVAGWVVVMSALLLSTHAPTQVELSAGAEWSYITGRLAPSFPLWPLLPIAAGYVGWKALRLEPWAELFAAALLFQVPIFVFLLVVRWDPRQYLVLQVLLLCALAILAVDLIRAALRSRREYTGLLKGGFATVIVVFILIMGAGRVEALISHNPAKPSDGGLTAQQDQRMEKWVAENIPRNAKVLTTHPQSAYLEFLDSGRHRWVHLQLDNRPVSKLPYDTVWLDMKGGCQSLSLSMSSLRSQLHQRNTKYIMITENSNRPHMLRLALRLSRGQGFKVEKTVFDHKSEVTKSRGLIMLKGTGKRLKKPLATQMDIPSVLSLKQCEEKRSPGYRAKIRSEFPRGIYLVPRFDGKLPASGEKAARKEHQARALISSIYRKDQTGP